MKPIQIIPLLFPLLSPLLLLAQDGDCPVRITYCDWFFSSYSETASIGFPLENKSAAEDGYDRFCAYQTMRAKGVLHFFQQNGRLKNREESLYFYYDPNTSGVAPSSLIPVDSFSVTNGDNVYLYHTSETEDTVSGNQVTLCESVPWNSASEQSGRTYGYGVMGLSYYDHVGSWVRSESDAVRDLLGKAVVLVGSEATSSGDWDMTEVFRYEYDLSVSGIRVERRWVDFEDWSCHVVVSAPLSGVTPWSSGLDSTLSDSVIISIDDTVPSVDYLFIGDSTDVETTTVKEKVDTAPVPQPKVKVGSYQWNSLYYEAKRTRMNERMENKVDEKDESQSSGTINKKGL